MADSIMALGSQRKNRTPQNGRNDSRTFNDEARGLIKNCVAELVHRSIVVTVILPAARQPPSLMRPQRRHKLAMGFQFLGWNHRPTLTAQKPCESAPQEVS